MKECTTLIWHHTPTDTSVCAQWTCHLFSPFSSPLSCSPPHCIWIQPLQRKDSSTDMSSVLLSLGWTGGEERRIGEEKGRRREERREGAAWGETASPSVICQAVPVGQSDRRECRHWNSTKWPVQQVPPVQLVSLSRAQGQEAHYCLQRLVAPVPSERPHDTGLHFNLRSILLLSEGAEWAALSWVASEGCWEGFVELYSLVFSPHGLI